MALQDFGFIGQNYVSRSPIADAESTINLYPEKLESGNGKNSFVLYPSPGMSLTGSGVFSASEVIVEMKAFLDLTSPPYTTLRSFALTFDFIKLTLNLYELVTPPYPAGAWTLRASQQYSGALVDFYGAYMAASGTQIVIGTRWTPSTGPQTILFSFAFATNAWAPISGFYSIGPSVAIFGLEFLDSYFIVATNNGFYVSAPGDPTTWSALSFATENDEPDGIVGLKQFQRQLWFFGERRIEAYYDSGNADFPMSRIPNGIIERGCAAGATVAVAASSLLWLGMDDHGTLVVWQSQGYNAVRVSTHNIENAINSFVTSAFGSWWNAPGNFRSWITARAYVYTENGHEFYVLNLPSPTTTGTRSLLGTFPTPPATYVYDLTEGLWHMRQSTTDGINYGRHPGDFYCFGTSGHMVSLFFAPSIYLIDTSLPDEAGVAILRTRTAPHLSTANSLNFYNEFLLDYDLAGKSATITLSWSNDGGVTFNPGVAINCGPGIRALWRRLGKSRDRVFRVQCNAPVTFINAFVDVEGGASQ